MLSVDVIEAEGIDLPDVEAARRSAASSARLIDAGRAWVDTAFEPYRKAGLAVDPVRLSVVIADDKGSIQLRVGGDIGSGNVGIRILGRLALALLAMDKAKGQP